MSGKRKIAADVLFGIQMVGMFVFVGAQFVRMMHSVQGISPAWLLCAEAFCVISLGLAYRGWKESPVRTTLQLLITHSGWTLGIGSLLVLLACKANEIVWGWYDVATLCVVACGAVVLVFIVGVRYRLGITDPILRGVLAAIFRGIPHLVLAYKIGLLGGAGLAALTVASAHVTAGVRIGQLGFAVREVGWDRSRRGMAIAEATSEITWIVVTIVWLFAR